MKLEISYYSEGEILTEEKYLRSSFHITLFELKDSSLVGSPMFVESLGGDILLSFVTKGATEKILINYDIK